MDVKEFFELSAGKWFSQKTSHHLTLKQSVQGKSDLAIDILPNDDAQIMQLCQQAGVDHTQIWGGAKYSWQGTTHWDNQQQSPANQQGLTIVMLLPQQPGANHGRLFQHIENSNSSPVVAEYTLGDDDALTLIIDRDGTHSEERIWFESPNVRLRTTVITRTDGDNIAAFYSEIRRIGA
jgi:CpeS-like protein